jgi:hypothetical protein
MMKVARAVQLKSEVERPSIERIVTSMATRPLPVAGKPEWGVGILCQPQLNIPIAACLGAKFYCSAGSEVNRMALLCFTERTRMSGSYRIKFLLSQL